jgi:hypothetical protein
MVALWDKNLKEMIFRRVDAVVDVSCSDCDWCYLFQYLSRPEDTFMFSCLRNGSVIVYFQSLDFIFFAPTLNGLLPTLAVPLQTFQGFEVHTSQ